LVGCAAPVCDTDDPGLDVLFVEGVWIEVAEPIFDVVMLRVLGIGEDFELGMEARIPPQSSGGAACSPAR
jgi:hypothetical protein